MAAIQVIIDSTTIADFRAFYPEFSDADKWSDTMILRSLHISIGEIGGSGWGIYEPYSMLQRGWFALTAYNLQIFASQAQAVGVVGSASTPYAMSSKSVGDESVSYATPGYISDLMPWESLLALSPYGIEFLHLRQRAGMGAICV